MKLSLKKIAVLTLALAASLAVQVTAFASESEEKIRDIRFKVSFDQDRPMVGEYPGWIDVEISNSANAKCSINDVYYDKDDDTWKRGEVPQVNVELTANDGYYFSSTKLSTTKSSYHAYRRSGSDKYTMNVTIKLDPVSGPVTDVENYDWDGKVAVWDEIEDADQYELRLYRNGGVMTTIVTNGNRYNFHPHMTNSGNYTFRIRGLSTRDGEKGNWSDHSSECFVSREQVYRGTPPAENQFLGGGWAQDARGWSYWLNGKAVSNSWIFVDNNWFYLDSTGYMRTGWVYVDNNWFYLNPISDGTRGAMQTGWVQIDGNWFYLNPISDGTRGAMKTGYQNVGGLWYFMDTANGVLWTNRYVPNGKWADASGVIH